MFAAADMDGDGYVSMEEMATFRRYYQAVDKDQDGNITAGELRRATEDIQRRGYEQQKALEQRQMTLQHEITTGADDLRALMEAVEQAKAQHANKPPARGATGRKTRREA